MARMTDKARRGGRAGRGVAAGPWRSVAAGLCVAALGSCATPTANVPTVSPEALATEAEEQRVVQQMQVLSERDRLFRIGYPMLAGGADQCADTAMAIGVHRVQAQGGSSASREAMRRLYGVAPGAGEAVVASVARGSPAERAGVRRGDVILASADVDAAPDPSETAASAADERGSGLDDRRPRPAPARVDKKPDSAHFGGIGWAPTSLTLRRSGGAETVSLTPEPVCGYAMAVVESDEVNAYADGDNIVFYTGMLRFLRDDGELATIFGHELAHNALGHVQAKRANTIVGTVAGGALDLTAAVLGVNTGGAFTEAMADIGQNAYSVSFEKEADYLGIYFMRLGGHETALAGHIWRRMAATTSGAGITKHSETHPATAERAVILQLTHKEILAKEAAGAPLTPNLTEERFGPGEGAPRATRAESIDG